MVFATLIHGDDQVVIVLGADDVVSRLIGGMKKVTILSYDFISMILF